MNVLDINLHSWPVENEQTNLLHVHAKWNEIPLLNVLESDQIVDNKLVRFRGMVQDIFDPEYYYESYQVTNKHTKETYKKCGKYRDAITAEDHEYINFDNNTTKQRQTVVVITSPALNEWVKHLQEQIHKDSNPLAGGYSQSTKRSLDEDSESSEHQAMSMETSNKKVCKDQSSKESKPSTTLSHDHFLNWPLPERTGKAIHLKLYDNVDNLKLNEMIECIGFLSMQSLVQEGDDSADEADENKMEVQTHNPPTSLIPKIHCLGFKRIEDTTALHDNIRMTDEEMNNIRKELEVALTQLLLGDQLAAEYLIYHLISRVYSRVDAMALGKFSVNLSNIPSQLVPGFGRSVYDVIEQIVTKSHYLPMTLDNMNDLAFIPKKDYDCNRMTSGILQLCNNTHLMMDETKMTAGKLNDSGVRAVAAISDVIRSQRCAYDFKFYHLEFDCDIPFLILSEGKSLLPSDFHIALHPNDEHITTFEEVFAALKQFLNADLLSAIRRFLINRRHAEYEISEEINELVQQEFVKMRENNTGSVEDLHNLLILARSICIASGKRVLDQASWHRACELEQERKRRLQP